MTSKDFEMVTHEQIRAPEFYRHLWNQSHLMSYEEFCARVAGADRGEMALQESREIVKMLRNEMEMGVYLELTWFCVVVRKNLK